MQKRGTLWHRVLTLVCALVPLAGCGANSGTSPSQAVQASNLAGNWLLVGGVPVFPAPLSGGTRLAMTFSVDGTQLTGSGEYLVSCGNIGGGAGVTVQGTLAADGSFVAQTSQTAPNIGASLLVKGHVPSAPGMAWSGSYALDTTNAGSCKVQLQDTLSAQPISSFSGTYTGAGIVVNGSTRTPLSVKLNLQQGSTVADASGQSITDTALLNGTLSLTGSSCFSTGTITFPANIFSLGITSVAGASIHPSFRMDDGSYVGLNAYASDVSADTLQDVSIAVLNGNCATSATQSLQITTLVRTH